jgi:hypothetical protein
MAETTLKEPFHVEQEEGTCGACSQGAPQFRVVGPDINHPGEEIADSISFADCDDAQDRADAYNAGHQVGWAAGVRSALRNMQDGDAIEAARELVHWIDKAGLLNLSNGVQLGATSWYCKTDPVLVRLREALAKLAA